jgi:hypothetical protein
VMSSMRGALARKSGTHQMFYGLDCKLFHYLLCFCPAHLPFFISSLFLLFGSMQHCEDMVMLPQTQDSGIQIKCNSTAPKGIGVLIDTTTLWPTYLSFLLLADLFGSLLYVCCLHFSYLEMCGIKSHHLYS